NASYISSRLPALGIDLYYMHQVGDNMERLTETLQRGLGRSDILFCTGGLGPTEDDLTREGIAKVFGETMKVDPMLEEELRAFFGNRALQMPTNNLKQATLIPSSRAIPNPVGTAPGWWAEKQGKIIICMPGPPREMSRMWEHEVAPELRKRTKSGILVSRTFKVNGLSEGLVDEMLGDMKRAANPSIGVYAKPDGIHVRVAAKAKDQASADALLKPVDAAIQKLFGNNLWGIDAETMQEHVGKLLTARRLTLATMESCTGGQLASVITDVPGASNYFKGGIVTYMTSVKERYGVPHEIIERHGVVSGETASAMAKAAREQLGADIGIGITGVAGPTEQEGKPVGTVFMAIDAGKKHYVHTGKYPGSRTDIKNRVVSTTLFQVRRVILEMDAK
ncbi:MAG: competence/damage-inducible protein A, partial [Chloroflexi bacterium]|nr:competence/damage-inducible protein A [Chloroflexota bacterium]